MIENQEKIDHGGKPTGDKHTYLFSHSCKYIYILNVISMFKELYENMENFSRELVLIKKNYL